MGGNIKTKTKIAINFKGMSAPFLAAHLRVFFLFPIFAYHDFCRTLYI